MEEKKDAKKLRDFFKKKSSELDEEIDDLIGIIRTCDPTSEDYKTYMSRLNELIKIRDELNGKSRNKKSVSPDTIAVCICNLVGIALVLGYEHYHPITSKAFGWILKGRV